MYLIQLMRKTVLSALLSVFVITSSLGQSAGKTSADSLKSNIVGPFDFKGTVEELTKSIKGAIVTVYEDDEDNGGTIKEIKKIVTGGNGEFAIKLEINKKYVIRVEKAGYTTKGIDIDTDVRLARPQYTKVPPFEFKVDMVKDLDGLAFKKSVANVFYQIRRNAFDYELDYSKEEMEEEERMLREQEEKRKIAELAAQKKFEMDEAAKLLRDMDDASMEQKIQAAITIGNNDERKTLETLVEVFPVSDTLRVKKAEIIYAALQKERAKQGKSSAPINYKDLFAAAVAYEQEVAAQVEQQYAKKNEELRAVRQEADRKKELAMAVQQQALEIEMREKIAAANLKAEEDRRTEEKEKNDKVYYAIFNANGDKKTAVANLQKTFPKGDPYAPQKAEAIYLEYERASLGGSTLAKIDFAKLFQAAADAEQLAIREDIAKGDAKDRMKADAYILKEAEQKAAQQKAASELILQNLQTAPKDDVSQMEVFVESFAKNDPYRQQKGQAMFEEYTAQQKTVKKTGSAAVALDFGAIFAAAATAETKAKQEEKETTFKQKTAEQEQLEKQREAVRQEKLKLGEKAAREAQEVHRAKMNEAKTQREREIGKALEAGGGDKEKTIRAIMATFPKGTELPELKAEAMFEAYIQESERLRKASGTGAKLDYSALFQAAEQAELVALQRQFEAMQAEEQTQLLAYEEKRMEKSKEAAQQKAQEAVKELAVAEKNYESTAQKVEQERLARIKEEELRKQEYEKQLAMEQARREALEKERQEQVLAKLEEERRSRMSAEERAKDIAESSRAEEKRRMEAQARTEAEKQAAQAEKDRQLALAAQRKAEEERLKEEAKRKAAADAAKAEADRLAAKAEQDRVKEEQRLKAEAESARIAAEQAAAKAAADKIAEEQRLKAEAERAKLLAEQAAAKAESERIKEEQRLKAEAEQAKLLADQAAAKAEAERIKEQQRLKAEEENTRIAAEQAAVKAEAERKRQEEIAAAAEVKRKEEEAKRVAAAEKQKRDEDIARLLAKGKQEESKDPAAALESYRSVLAMDATNKDALAGQRTAQLALDVIAKAEAERKALEDRYKDLIIKGEKELSTGYLAEAKKTFTSASQLMPNGKEAKDWLAEVKRREDELAAAEEERRQRERRYVLLMQEGGLAMGANNLALAKLKYGEASQLKPDETEPAKKLEQIAATEKQIADLAEEKRVKEEEAKRKFQEQQMADAEKKAKADKARLDAMAQADAAKGQQKQAAESAELERAAQFDRIKENIEKLNMNAEDQRKAFLSELSKLYPLGVTEETVKGKNYQVQRYVINEQGIVTVYEKRTWDWGGIFWFKNGDIAITESLYKLELGKYGK
jgi:hypothetical protein